MSPTVNDEYTHGIFMTSPKTYASDSAQDFKINGSLSIRVPSRIGGSFFFFLVFQRNAYGNTIRDCGETCIHRMLDKLGLPQWLSGPVYCSLTVHHCWRFWVCIQHKPSESVGSNSRIISSSFHLFKIFHSNNLCLPYEMVNGCFVST